MELNNVPDEVLYQIFDYLDVYELKPASLVCRRWAELTFSGRRMKRVCLEHRISDFDFFSNTKRNYLNIKVNALYSQVDQFESLVRLLRTLKSNIRMLDLKCDVTSEQLRLLLLEAPKLEYLKIKSNCKTNGPFTVLPDDHFNIICRSMPSLQSLNMRCTCDFELKVWKHLSGQLKLAHVLLFCEEYIEPFLELTFPLLEDLSLRFGSIEELVSGRSHEFFKRHPLLRELSIRDLIPLQCFESITRHCPELTYLHLLVKDPEEDFLESLAQLTKLKHLSLEGKVARKKFHGGPKSLELVELDLKNPELLLESLFAPQLKYLKINNAHLVHLMFICDNFSYLQHLEVNVKDVIGADDSVRLNNLTHLLDLKLRGPTNIDYIHHENVRCLTISRGEVTSIHFQMITHTFPALQRLILEKCSVSLAYGEFLYKVMPHCRVDYRKRRFYPIENSYRYIQLNKMCSTQ
ncbi:uncharacterized protein LOC131211441 [Anopheles bellator]|uniref:uncharacterized protein LOC131211441 n=1 Tax=Anopheles bellator TaxID=139047 RepID=UPI002648FEC1|nr:uncharacterized protein LOC131211441 [Anopheles bellator]